MRASNGKARPPAPGDDCAHRPRVRKIRRQSGETHQLPSEKIHFS